MLESLAPVDADASAPGRVHFAPEDLEQQLDQLMGDIRDLRERVQHLVGLVPEDAVVDGTATNGHATTGVAADADSNKKNKKKKKKKKKKKNKNKNKKKSGKKSEK